MLLRQFSISTLIFIFVFLIQEAVINQLRLPGGGFSLPLLMALTWAALSTPTVGALTGFISGLFMDLSQNSSGAMGHWTLIMILACYAVAYWVLVMTMSVEIQSQTYFWFLLHQ
jgi:rod shape-determining protein MreD